MSLHARAIPAALPLIIINLQDLRTTTALARPKTQQATPRIGRNQLRTRDDNTVLAKRILRNRPPLQIPNRSRTASRRDSES